MRVIAGSAKGRTLVAAPGSGTRPISDRVKESLFNILGQAVVDSRVLDLFAGTGSVGIEALSRGAEKAVFVEKNRRAVETIHKNLRTTGLSARSEVLQADVFTYLRNPREQRFDFIYVAPPQYKGLWLDTLHALDRATWLAPDGEIIVQIFPKELVPFELSTLSVFDKRKYGSTLLLFLARPNTRN